MTTIDTSTAEHYTWGKECDGWHLVRTDALSVIEERMPPGSEEARHAHERARQFFFVLSGRATIECDGTRHHLGPQQGIEIAPGLSHQVFNESADALHFLVISSPPSHGDRVPR
jgi:mannose-6-phosphate isomerase-like protein (cupin superfamily)